jgi:endonuclease/exonuclease/phosphatase family metal-dependent hydrolase
MGAKMDIHRGLPIIHMNFLGYDEQSHRRGPDSRFAMWTLKGIDYAIKRVWRDAARAERRRYDVWIYSDHGQCSTTPYHRITGYSLEEAVRTTLAQLGITDGEVQYPAGPSSAIPAQYDTTSELFRRDANCMCAAHRNRALLPSDPPDVVAGPRVAGLGPVAFLYFSSTMTVQQLTLIAQQLISVHQVPCVLLANPDGTATAFTPESAYALPAQVNALCGDNHPFMDCVAEDLLQLCRHPDAGDLTLLGWSAGAPQLTFAAENGSHGGIATAETTAFALLPPKAAVGDIDTLFIRPSDIRNAALAHLGRLTSRARSTPLRKQVAAAQSLRILTYNVHSCIGTDGRLSTDRIARLIAEQAPHIVALQEVDVGRSRTGGHDQARQIARWLEMAYYFHPSLHVEEEQYGNVILTHLPMQLVKAGPLPGVSGNASREPRGALWAAIEFDGQEIQVINTHLGLSPSERQQQVDHLMGQDWLGKTLKSPQSTVPVILCGDFNALPSSRPMRQLRTQLQDVQELVGARPPLATFHSFFPAARIDHILVNGLQVDAVHVPRSLLARTASDHLPLVADLRRGEARTQQ